MQSESNLFSFRIQLVGDKFTLERNGNYHLDDNVNKFISGAPFSSYFKELKCSNSRPVSKSSLVSSDGGHSLAARQMFFTASGRIGVVIDADEQLSLHLSSLQRNLENVIHGPGNNNHAMYVNISPRHYSILIL